MNSEQKLLASVLSTLIDSSNAVESIRRKLSAIDKTNFLKAQEHLVASIQYMKRGKHSIDTHIDNEKQRG